MTDYDYIIMGSSGLVGGDIIKHLKEKGSRVLGLTSENFELFSKKDISTKYFINANGNSYRYKANIDPFWDFQKSVASVLSSIEKFSSTHYIFFSTIDVYPIKNNPLYNREDSLIDINKLDYYATNKYFAESIISKYHPSFLILRLGTVVSNLANKGPLFDLTQKKLYINPKSKLSLIDSDHIIRALNLLEDNSAFNQIYNLTGTGNASLESLIKDYKIELDSNINLDLLTSLDYDVSNQKLSKIMEIADSYNIASSFLNVNI